MARRRIGPILILEIKRAVRQDERLQEQPLPVCQVGRGFHRHRNSRLARNREAETVAFRATSRARRLGHRANRARQRDLAEIDGIGRQGCIGKRGDKRRGRGKIGGRPFVDRYGRYVLITAHDMDVADRFFTRHGQAAIFISRLLPIVRTFISLPAGIARMDRTRFHLYTFVGSLPWCLALAWIGYKLGEKWNTLGAYFHKLDAVIGVLIVAGVAWFVYDHLKNRSKG